MPSKDLEIQTLVTDAEKKLQLVERCMELQGENPLHPNLHIHKNYVAVYRCIFHFARHAPGPECNGHLHSYLFRLGFSPYNCVSAG